MFVGPMSMPASPLSSDAPNPPVRMSAKKKHSGLSLRALAARAGVSVSTASRALRNHTAISAPVRKRIQAPARKHGYEINPLVAQVYAKARAGRGMTS